MITLKTLLTYQKFHNNVEKFLRKKATEYRNAENGMTKNDSYGEPPSIFRGFEIEERVRFINGSLVNDGKEIIVSFGWECDLEIDTYTLPLERLFDDDFYDQMKAVFDEKREKRAEKKRDEEKELYEILKKKYENGEKNND